MRLMSASEDLRFQCYWLEGPQDADAYAYTYWLREKTSYPDLPDFLQQSSLESAEEFLTRSKDQHFVLWDAKAKRMIGATNIVGLFEFKDSYIASDMQGQGLSKLLYNARLRFMGESLIRRFALAKITHANKPSINAALGNGFKLSKLYRDFNSGYYYRFVGRAPEDIALSEARQAVFEDPKPLLDNS